MPGIEARAPERTESRSGLAGSPNACPVWRPTSATAASTCAYEIGRVGLVVGVEKGADLGGDGEPGGHGQAERGHLVQVRALAAEQVLHFAAALGAFGAEGIDPLRHCWLPEMRAQSVPRQARECNPMPKLTHPTP